MTENQWITSAILPKAEKDCESMNLPVEQHKTNLPETQVQNYAVAGGFWTNENPEYPKQSSIAAQRLLP